MSILTLDLVCRSVNVNSSGDVQLVVYHKHLLREEKMFKVWFNTRFIESDIPHDTNIGDDAKAKAMAAMTGMYYPYLIIVTFT
jgi:hypothetical protein